ncbi:arsenosugar biosynthesis radical SAM protein ArsS [Kiritimatiellaeota bacterium B1221]|nr:arsenosugar biosynthesis radical SAM protein ArsS [Kiritimatiellaeota bacterium B1221]
MIQKTSGSFDDVLTQHGQWLERAEAKILQINVGKMCNLACVHCHVGAGPTRKEIMIRECMDKILEWSEDNPLPVVDLTGGAPEMFPHFREMVTWFRSRGVQVMDRCNLTILLQPGYEWAAEFLRDQQVEIVASMPCYSPENVNAQRGNGVFDESIEALQLLNRLGYGVEEGLPLNLVYNPNGAFLPPDQEQLEAVYKRELQTHFGIQFHQLYALTNLPVSRFASYLKQRGSYEEYLQLLKESFNPASVNGLMCRDTISVDWEGRVFDCDFNQQMEMQTGFDGEAQSLWDLDLRRWKQSEIRTAPHCFGCTAGQGSSCGGKTS